MVKKEKKVQQKDNTRYVAGVIIAIIVIVAIILLVKNISKQPAEAPVSQQPSPEKEIKEEEKGLVPTEKPIELKNCSEEFAIGIPKNTLGEPCKIEGNVAKLILRYSGKGTSLPGIWFKVIESDGSVSYFKSKTEMKQNEEKMFEIPIKKKESIIAMPMKIENGKENACLNQQIKVIKDESCVG